MLALLIPGVGMGGGTAAAPSFSGTIPDITETENTGTYTFGLGSYFSSATSYSIAPSIEAGWTFDASTAQLVIDTDALGAFGPYTVTGTNAVGSADSNPFAVNVIAAVVVTQPEEKPAGGWSFWIKYEQELKRRDADKRRRERLEEETERIESPVDREIAELLREQEAKDERRAELERLRKIAKENADIERVRQYSDRVAKAFEEVLTHQNLAAARELDKQLRLAAEEEEFLMLAAELLLRMH